MNHARPSLQQLHHADRFSCRHVGPCEVDQLAMLNSLGFSSLDQMIDSIVPKSIHRKDRMQLKPAKTEHEALALLHAMAKKNMVLKSYIGLGYHNTFTPPTIQRNILENPAWYTAYTPYQAEISQGRLEAMFNYQTMIADLTGMELANASMLDEATACAEAMTLCQRISKSKSNVFFVAEDCHPQNIDVVKTRAASMGIKIIVGDPQTADLASLGLFGILLQYPNTKGEIIDYTAFCENAHGHNTMVAVSADLLSLTLLKAPGEFGADVAIGNTQRFGVPMMYGGPHAAYMATRDAYKRSMPGRLIGLSIDSHGNPAYRLALQTREQHIRREKATSNICTAQALLAVMACMYAVYHGPDGLKNIAQRVHRLTTILANGLSQSGIKVLSKQYFDTITLETGEKTEQFMHTALQKGYNLRCLDSLHISIALDETTTTEDIIELWKVFAGDQCALNIEEVDKAIDDLPATLVRTSSYLKHSVFNSYHSETEMMRYMRALADKDLALDRAMIPLGSCTMKLNAASEMMPVSWPEFTGLHPYAPLDQAQGYHQLTDELEQMLCAATGYDAVSLQPNSGAQGEYTGLLAIRSYHQSRGESHRDICLIPASAHGTNPASAHMAGMQVVVVATDDHGNISLDDLKSKLETHKEKLAAIMITYPSTHGVFEEGVVEVCKLVHQYGGQVYIDGANMNAMVGLCAPGTFGGDVSHINLHKTFAIPHGGGGPGVGPIGVKEHLKPFLPGYSMLAGGNQIVGPVSGAAWGSAGVLSISWMYISMMGSEGLAKATQVAILNANYLANRLKGHYPVLYSDANGMVAHECILDLRPIKDETGITVDDVAKRLIDYGFHAPTMSFPVPGTLMVEPTESEDKWEIDRFCDAMIAIKHEIDLVASGQLDKDDNPLKNAPHTVDSVSSDEWTHPYSRKLAAYPVDSLRDAKYWSPVGRVDNVYGDRNLVCTCAPLSDYTTHEE